MRVASRLQKQLEGNDREDVYPEPARQVALGDLVTIGNDVVVVIDNGRVEDQDDVDEEEAVDGVVDDVPLTTQLIVIIQSYLRRCDDARENQQHCDEHVPVEFEGIARVEEAKSIFGKLLADESAIETLLDFVEQLFVLLRLFDCF